jgi:hypothetical protein
MRLGEFFKEYWWKVAAVLIAGSIAWANLSARVESVDRLAHEHEPRIKSLEKSRDQQEIRNENVIATLEAMDKKLDRLLRK